MTDYSTDEKQVAKRTALAIEKALANNAALELANKILKENPDINVDYLIANIKGTILTTTRSAQKLGISLKAFLRLRKKYNIKPVSMVKKSEHPKFFSKNTSHRAIRNYFSIFQLDRIPQSEIAVVQSRAAKALKLPNKIKWKPRGTESNGKLKPKVSALSKNQIFTWYDERENKYRVKDYNKQTEVMMSKQEVDRLNLKYARLKAFV